MIEYMKCRQEHLRLIKPQEGFEQTLFGFLNPELARIFEEDFCLSAWEGNTCIGAAGLMQMLPHSAVAWAFVSDIAGPSMLEVVRKIRKVLDAQSYGRIVMNVRCDYAKGHKLAKLCGFEVETPCARKNGYFAEDETVYVRIR